MDTTEQLPMTSPLPEQAKSHTVVNSRVEVRNLFVGGFGLLLNVLAFTVVFKSVKVNQTRKLLLLNMILSDAILMVSLCVYGVVESTKFSDNAECVVMINLIILTILTSYAFVLQLSFVNYLAVCKPFHYRRLLTVRNVGVSVTVVWMALVGCCHWWVGLYFAPGMSCAPLVNIPQAGLVGVSAATLLSTFGVMAANTAVVTELKKSRFTNPLGNTGTARTVSCERDHQTARPSTSARTRPGERRWGFQMNTAAAISHRLWKTLRPKVHPQPVAGPVPEVRRANVKEHKAISSIDEIVCQSQISTAAHLARPCEMVPRALPPPCHSQETTTSITKTHLIVIPENENSYGPSPSSLLHQPPSSSSSSLSPKPTSSSSSLSPGILAENHPKRERRRNNTETVALVGGPNLSTAVPASRPEPRNAVAADKVVTTLLILTTYCCLLSLPPIIYMICVAGHVIPDPEGVIATPVGVLISSCPLINACVNPVFHVFSFLNWTEIGRKLRLC